MNMSSSNGMQMYKRARFRSLSALPNVMKGRKMIPDTIPNGVAATWRQEDEHACLHEDPGRQRRPDCPATKAERGAARPGNGSMIRLPKKKPPICDQLSMYGNVPIISITMMKLETLRSDRNGLGIICQA